MKNISKKLILLGMSVIMGVSVVGCGKSNDVSTSGKAAKDYVYVPEYQEMTDQSDISSIVISNNTIYYSGGSYDETADTYQMYIKSMEVGTTEGKELPIQLSTNDSINGIMADEEGNLIFVLNTYIQGESEEDFTQTYTLKKYDKEGNEIFSNDLTPLISGESSPYIQYSALDGQGNIYISNGENKIWVLDAKGTLLFSLDVETYMQGFGTTKEGNVVFATYAQENMVLQEVDFANKKLGAQYDNIPVPNGNYAIMKGINKGCLISTGNSLYEYDFTTSLLKKY